MMSDSKSYANITFEPTGRSAVVLPGTLVLEAAMRVGLPIDAPCGGAGTCGKCRVRFMTNAPAANAAEQRHLGEQDLAAGWRLACQTRLNPGATTITIPARSLFAESLQILTDSEEILEADRPAPHDDLPPEIVPRDGEPNTAVAFDLGTTTLVGEMVDLATGRELGIAAGMNPQVSFGDDVVSRIGRAIESPAAARELRHAVRDAIEDLLDELCRKTDRPRESIRAVSFAGNTTMQHLFCGLRVDGLSALPFAPERFKAMCVPATELGLQLDKSAHAYVFPVIGGFVGGDTVAGILVRNLDQAEAPVLMIDIGTNGEIVLAGRGELRAASAAAGPAFEGARISCGMRAANGAIEKVTRHGEDILISVIGGGAATGLCGSALVDAAAELMRLGLLEDTGRLLPPDALPAELPAPLRRRVRANAAGEVEFVLSFADESGAPDVVLTQKDIRELQLATGALRAGVEILLQQAGVEVSELDRVLIAGGFGSFIRRNNAQRIGLLPPGTPRDKISYVGNVSLHGAKRALASSAARARLQAAAAATEHVELSNDMEFQMRFAEAMIFPSEE
jgi:uncharacterized 2Fe-2S/4Fe-4S cluster protein (DUF4445 family)